MRVEVGSMTHGRLMPFLISHPPLNIEVQVKGRQSLNC
jgi:hypothetical protein